MYRKFIIDDFLRVVLQQDYSFRYMTIDMDPRNVHAIQKHCDRDAIQLCLWHIKRALLKTNSLPRKSNTWLNPPNFTLQHSWFDINLFEQLRSRPDHDEANIRDVTEKTTKIISSVARDSLCFYAYRCGGTEQSPILAYSKTEEQIYEELLRKVYEYILVENKKFPYFQYLCQYYLNPAKFKLWSHVSKPYVPRMSHMMNESFFKVLKHNFLQTVRVFRLDTVLFILNQSMDYKFDPKLNRRIKKFTTMTQMVANFSYWQKNMLLKVNQLVKTLDFALSQGEVEHNDYHVDVDLWLCQCGEQKFNPFFMQASGKVCYFSVRYREKVSISIWFSSSNKYSTGY